MATTGDARIARHVRRRNQGLDLRDENEVIGFNTRMTGIQAAIGRVQLTRLTEVGEREWAERRRPNATFLDARLRGARCRGFPRAPSTSTTSTTIRVPGHDREAFACELSGWRGVRRPYPISCDRLTSCGLALDLLETEAAALEVIWLPVHPAFAQNELGRVVAATGPTGA